MTWVNPLDGADAVGIRAEQVGVAREHRQQLALPCQGLAFKIGKNHRRRRSRCARTVSHRHSAHTIRHIDRRQVVDDLHGRGAVGIERDVVVRLFFDRRGHRRRRARCPSTATGIARTRRPTARATGPLSLCPLALIVLLTTSFRILALGDIAKHTTRARAHRLQIQTQQIGNLDKVRVDHIAVAQRIDKRQRIFQRLSATARRGDVTRLLQRTVDKVHKRLGSVDARLQCLATMCGDELHGVVAVGEHHAAQVHGILLDKLNRATGGLLARCIAVEHIHDALGKASERLDVMLREGGAQRGDNVFNPRLPAGDAIGIALYHDGGILRDDKLLGPIKAVEVSLFMKHARLGGVEILRLAVAHNATAKGNVVTLLVKDGEHHAVVKAVGKLPAPATHGNVGVDHLLRGKTRLGQVRHQRVTARCKAQAVAAADVAAHAAAGKVLARTAVLTAHEHGVVELGGLGAQIVDAGTLGAALAAISGVMQLNTRAIGQVTD